jgi:hypothetical protein
VCLDKSGAEGVWRGSEIRQLPGSAWRCGEPLALKANTEAAFGEIRGHAGNAACVFASRRSRVRLSYAPLAEIPANHTSDAVRRLTARSRPRPILAQTILEFVEPGRDPLPGASDQRTVATFDRSLGDGANGPG